MTEEEFASLLQYLQEQMLQIGEGLHELAQARARDTRPVPSLKVLAYLDALAAELRLGTEATPREILLRLRQIAATETGEPISGVSIAMVEGDAVTFGVQEVDLAAVSPDLEAVIHELERLRGDLAESREEG